MKRVYIPYWEWEDWINGMWAKGDESQIQAAIIFTSDWVIYGQAMQEVVKVWPRTMLNSLTNTSINRRAFLGHCAVSYKTGIPESITRAAWKFLTDEQRTNADAEATKVIKEYERSHNELHKNVAGSVLPGAAG